MTKPTIDDLTGPLLDLLLAEAKEDLQRSIESLAEKVVYKMLEDSFQPTLQKMVAQKIKEYECDDESLLDELIRLTD